MVGLRRLAVALVTAFSVAPLHAQDPERAQRDRAAVDDAIRLLEEDPHRPPGIAQAGDVRLLDVSLDILFAVGSSTERDDSLENLQGGGHDPRKRGFTMQQAELGISGALDDYFRAEAYISYFTDPIEGESEFEIEEAFLTTTALPHGFEVEAGLFFTEFGRHNPIHPHGWDWLDQPVILSRVFGPDGMRGLGTQVRWTAPTAWQSEVRFGLQNASGETLASFYANDEFFDERPVGGRPFVDQDFRSFSDFVYSARFQNTVEVGETANANLGFSFAYGPNATGTDGETKIYGVDFELHSGCGQGCEHAGGLLWQSEFVFRDYEADGFTDPGDPTVIGDEIVYPRDDLEDWGIYTQVMYEVAPHWRAGLRYEYASGSGTSFDPSSGADVGRAADPFRDDRFRISPIVVWQFTDFSRLRLQYNYDDADHLDDGDAHSFWLGAEVFLSALNGHGHEHDH